MRFKLIQPSTIVFPEPHKSCSRFFVDLIFVLSVSALCIILQPLLAFDIQLA
jgi:hypothetical protein